MVAFKEFVEGKIATRTLVGLSERDSTSGI